MALLGFIIQVNPLKQSLYGRYLALSTLKQILREKY